jgi:hypothetical protein
MGETLKPYYGCMAHVIPMRSVILTDLERRQARSYLKQDGERTVNIQVLVLRAKRYIPQLRSDLDLLEKLIGTYERNKTK